jgi:CRP-like cAMP-binding protein
MAQLSPVDLYRGQVLVEPDRRIDKVYFPHSGVISCIVELRSGDAIETGMIGKDGAFGAGHAFDGRVSMNRAVMLTSGVASVISSERLVSIANEFPALENLLLDYEHFLFVQVQQTAACNAVHDVQARTCKWLLRMHELAGPEILLTQESLAQMIGVRRTSVTSAASEMQEAGLITYARGHLRINNIDSVRQCACECDEDIRSHYRRIMKTN